MGIQKILRATGVVDGDFLPDIPTKLIERGEYNHVPIMIGVTKDEGLLQMVQFVINPDLYFYAALGWENLGPMFLLGKTGTWDRTPEEEEMVREITKFYLRTWDRCSCWVRLVPGTGPRRRRRWSG